MCRQNSKSIWYLSCILKSSSVAVAQTFEIMFSILLETVIISMLGLCDHAVGIFVFMYLVFQMVCYSYRYAVQTSSSH